MRPSVLPAVARTPAAAATRRAPPLCRRHWWAQSAAAAAVEACAAEAWVAACCCSAGGSFCTSFAPRRAPDGAPPPRGPSGSSRRCPRRRRRPPPPASSCARRSGNPPWSSSCQDCSSPLGLLLQPHHRHPCDCAGRCCYLNSGFDAVPRAAPKVDHRDPAAAAPWPSQGARASWDSCETSAPRAPAARPSYRGRPSVLQPQGLRGHPRPPARGPRARGARDAQQVPRRQYWWPHGPRGPCARAPPAAA
mmetsp:Transcript_10321/g.30292  ORF Transcript_10321/g.30292 Transcript_10321/m.30292 type:complete len:249 (-) Transcript_10321:700-1446(-)